MLGHWISYDTTSSAEVMELLIEIPEDSRIPRGSRIALPNGFSLRSLCRWKGRSRCKVCRWRVSWSGGTSPKLFANFWVPFFGGFGGGRTKKNIGWKLKGRRFYLLHFKVGNPHSFMMTRFVCIRITFTKTNIAAKDDLFQKDSPFPGVGVQVRC